MTLSSTFEEVVAAESAGRSGPSGWVHRGGAGPVLLLDGQRFEVFWNGVATPLARSPLLFRLFDGIAGQSLDREALFERVWARDYRPPSSDNTLFVNVNRLRRLFREVGLVIASDPNTRGYRLEPAASVWVKLPEGEPENNGIGAEVDRFFGRTRELAEMEGSTSRWIALTGLTGTGKSRLARRFALDNQGRWATSWWVDVDPGADVAVAVAEKLGVNVERGNAAARVGSALRGSEPRLLVIDGAEGVDSAVMQWLGSAVGLTVLSTSQTRPIAAAAHVIAVGPLEPAAGAALFGARAAAQGAGTVAPAIVARIVAALDGIPLAIEIAASRAPIVPVERLLADVQCQPGDRLRAAVESSWERLDLLARRALVSWSICEGGFRFDAAEALLGEWPGDALLALRDASLLRIEDVAGEPRFALYKAAREFAATRVTGPTELASRHTAFYSQWAKEMSATVYTAAQHQVVRALRADLPNVMAVFRRPAVSGPERAAALVAVEPALRATIPAHERQVLYAEAVALVGDDPIGLPVRLAQCWATMMVGRTREADEALSALLPRLEGHPLRVRAIRYLSRNALFDGRIDDALTWIESVAGASEHPRENLIILSERGRVLQQADRTEDARVATEAALAGFRALGDRTMHGHALLMLAQNAYNLADYDAAEAAAAEGAALFYGIDDRTNEAYARRLVGHSRLARGEVGAAIAELQAAIAIPGQVWVARSTPFALFYLAMAHLQSGDLALAEAAVARAAADCADDSTMVSLSRAVLAPIAVERGRYREAEAHSRDASETALALGARHDAAEYAAELVDAIFLSGRLEDARTECIRQLALAPRALRVVVPLRWRLAVLDLPSASAEAQLAAEQVRVAGIPGAVLRDAIAVARGGGAPTSREGRMALRWRQAALARQG